MAHNEHFHLGLLLVVVPVALMTLFKQKNIHGETVPLTLVISGIFFLLSAILSESFFHSETGEVVLTSIGSLLLASGHLLNMKFAKAVQN